MKKVLVAPLDWGLGHATRCIPIILKLIARNCEVMIAGSGQSLLLLRKEFPKLRCYTLAGYDPEYPGTRFGMVWKMIAQLPKFVGTISSEHKQIEKIVAAEKIELLISDNRYGCWSASVPSVFITHQSNIMMPKRFGWLQGIVRTINENYIRKFTYCWIPDLPGDKSFAGELASFGKFKNIPAIDHIGPLSRFSNQNTSQVSSKKYRVLAIFSGPEPQRTILEKIVSPQLIQLDVPYFIVRGVISSNASEVTETTADYLTANDLKNAITQSELVIARSGYSTIMDLSALGAHALFIPTPGQTEQEYLAKRLKEMDIANCQAQNKFSLVDGLRETQKFKGFPPAEVNGQFLDRALDKVLNLNEQKRL